MHHHRFYGRFTANIWCFLFNWGGGGPLDYVLSFHFGRDEVYSREVSLDLHYPDCDEAS